MAELEKDIYDPNILPDLLPLYYKRLFPHKLLGRWLTYGSFENSVFKNREISFILQDDIYLRYLSFENPSELEKEICNRNPHKIDIGPIFSDEPKKHRGATNMRPVQRELVFDIDMTDYDQVRVCCEGAQVCEKCWKYMIIACRILDSALREDFGFQHILWVFSGRRGIHCWVCDKTARFLNAMGRDAIASYLQVVTYSTSGENRIPKVVFGEEIHPSLKRALKIIEPMFEEVCLVDQNLFGTPKGLKYLLLMVPDEQIRKDLEKQLQKHKGNSKNIWEHFNKYINSLHKQNLNGNFKNIIEEIQLGTMYPRLDINVTKGFNHLLKSPFCIHPGTGKVCVPFNPSAAGKFDPTTVPTITQLLEEINAFDDKNQPDNENETKNRIKDYKKTGMFKGVVVFEEFLRKLENSYKIKAIDVSDMKMEF